MFTSLVLICNCCAAFIDFNNEAASKFSNTKLSKRKGESLSSETVGGFVIWMVADADTWEAISNSGIDDRDEVLASSLRT